MKLKGLNTESTKDVKILDSMYTGLYTAHENGELDNNSTYAIENEHTIKQVKELSERYKKLQAYVNKNSVKGLYKLENINGSAFARGGMGYHNINVNDTRENLLDRLKSIKEHGLLASEWFGIRYDTNEAPFCVSFHKVQEDCFVENLKTDEKQFSRDYISFPEEKGMAFFVDIENETLYPLLNPKDIIGTSTFGFGDRFYGDDMIKKKAVVDAKREVIQLDNKINSINKRGLGNIIKYDIETVIKLVGTNEEKRLLEQATESADKATEISKPIKASIIESLKDSKNPEYNTIYNVLTHNFKDDIPLKYLKKENEVINDLLVNNPQDFPEQVKLWQEYLDLEGQSDKIYKQLYLRIMDAPESEVESWRKQVYDKTYNKRKEHHKQAMDKEWDYVYNHVYHVFSGVPSAFINGIALPKELSEDKEFVEQVSTLFPQAMIFDREGEIIKDYSKLSQQ